MDELVINGVKLELDLMDADVLEVYERECEEMQKASEAVGADKSLSNADGIRKLCGIVDQLFDNLFGDGTAEELFGPGNSNLRPRITAFSQIVDYARSQSEKTSEMFKTNPYSPQRISNREPRKVTTIEREPTRKVEAQKTYNTNPQYQYLSPEEKEDFKQWAAERAARVRE